MNGYVIFDKPCWESTNAPNASGYAQVWHNGKAAYHHRVIWELLHGPIAPGLDIDHLCGNRRCIEVTHLRTCTRSENLRARRPAALLPPRRPTEPLPRPRVPDLVPPDKLQQRADYWARRYAAARRSSARRAAEFTARARIERATAAQRAGQLSLRFDDEPN